MAHPSSWAAASMRSRVSWRSSATGRGVPWLSGSWPWTPNRAARRGRCPPRAARPEGRRRAGFPLRRGRGSARARPARRCPRVTSARPVPELRRFPVGGGDGVSTRSTCCRTRRPHGSADCSSGRSPRSCAARAVRLTAATRAATPRALRRRPYRDRAGRASWPPAQPGGRGGRPCATASVRMLARRKLVEMNLDALCSSAPKTGPLRSDRRWRTGRSHPNEWLAVRC